MTNVAPIQNRTENSVLVILILVRLVKLNNLLL